MGESRSLASLGRPRDILRCNVRLHAPIPNRMQLVRISALYIIVATVIDYFSLLVTACSRLFSYHCLAPVLAGKNEHRLVLFAGKSEHHLDPVNTCFTPTNFYVHGSQVKVHPGARACGFRFRHHVRVRTHTHQAEPFLHFPF